jgi:NADH-quinone oxidoreductase subunit J
MSSEQLIFYLLAFGTLVSAVCVVLPPMGRNPIHSAIALIVSFFFLAGIYALLGAHLLAGLQIIVYAGAIMVLFTFVIMLLNLSEDEMGEGDFKILKVLGGLMVIFVFGKLLTAFDVASTLTHQAPSLDSAAQTGFGGVEEVGRLVYTVHMVPFELVGVLLLVAVVGAVVMAKRHLSTSGDKGGQA